GGLPTTWRKRRRPRPPRGEGLRRPGARPPPPRTQGCRSGSGGGRVQEVRAENPIPELQGVEDLPPFLEPAEGRVPPVQMRLHGVDEKELRALRVLACGRHPEDAPPERKEGEFAADLVARASGPVPEAHIPA